MTKITEQGKSVAQREVEARRATKPVKIDNASLPAGSPMYYYCHSCGHLADIKPEGWWMGEVKRLCGECQVMKDLGWLE